MEKLIDFIITMKKIKRKISIVLLIIFALFFIPMFIKACIDNMKGGSKNADVSVEKTGNNIQENNIKGNSDENKIKIENGTAIYYSGNTQIQLGKDAVLSKEQLEKSQYVTVKDNPITIEEIKQGKMAIYNSAFNNEVCKIDLNGDGKEETIKHVVKNAITDEVRNANFFNNDLYEHILLINDEEKLSVMSYFKATKFTIFSLKDGTKDTIVIGMYVLDNALSKVETPYDTDSCENTVLYIYEGNETKTLNKAVLGMIDFDLCLMNTNDEAKKGTVILKNGQIITFGSDTTTLNNGTKEEPKSLWVTYIYKLEDGKLVEASANNVHYYKLGFNKAQKVWPVTIGTNIELYAKPNLASNKVVVKPQQAVPISVIYNHNDIMPQDKWIYIITQSGQKGWFYVEKRTKEIYELTVNSNIYMESTGMIFKTVNFQ